ncbi:MAG: hypothetical protein MI923_22870, partial [Phycisphaerales bacterium]|nr:hypothetical protein [Phycisphaerales bacterium]
MSVRIRFVGRATFAPEEAQKPMPIKADRCTDRSKTADQSLQYEGNRSGVQIRICGCRRCGNKQTCKHGPDFPLPNDDTFTWVLPIRRKFLCH